MASPGPFPYGEPQGQAPPQYWECRNYPSAPGLDDPSKYRSDQGPSPAYDLGLPTTRISVPNAYGRYSDSGSGADIPLQNVSGQGHSSGYGQPQPLQNVSGQGHSPGYGQPQQNVSGQGHSPGYGQPQPLQNVSGQGHSPGYGQPQPNHVSVPNAFERYSDSGSGADIPMQNASRQGHSSGYGQPQPIHVSVPNAFERYSDSASGANVPLKNDYGQGHSPGYGQPQPVHVSVPNAFDRCAESDRPVSGASQPQSSRLTAVFSDHPQEESTVALNSNYSDSNLFSDKAIRRGFIRKVYLILTAQLSVTIAFIAVFIFIEPINEWVRREGLWCYIVAYVIFMTTYFVLVCFRDVRRMSPANFICLSIFTVAFSYLTATISSFHDTKIVLLAAGITGAVCLAISLFAIQTKVDFTMCSGLIFALLMVLFFFGCACIITYYCWGYNHIMDTVYAGLGALVFAVVLVYNTQMIVGGRKHELSAEEYIYGALQLYLDVIYIFLFLLSLMGKKK